MYKPPSYDEAESWVLKVLGKEKKELQLNVADQINLYTSVLQFRAAEQQAKVLERMERSAVRLEILTIMLIALTGLLVYLEVIREPISLVSSIVSTGVGIAIIFIAISAVFQLRSLMKLRP